MIPFFRKIRKKMADDNKPFKYMRYAIGEIALVVIGILIALSINNWNESQKEKKTVQSIYSIVAKDLQNDINDLNEILRIYEFIKPCYEKILEGIMTKEDYSKDKNCSGILMGFPDFSMDLRGFNLLNNYKYNAKSENDSLALDIVQFYTKQTIEIGVNEASKVEHFNNNYEYWKSNSTWFSNYIFEKRNTILNEEFIEYSINSQDYKNRVAMSYLMNYQVLIPQYEEFMGKAKNLVIRIEEYNSQQ